MLSPKNYLQCLKESGITFYSGVPDSLLKEFCACVTDQLDEKSHIIAANEGAAIALGIGHHIGTGNVPLVYMQNSGLGNIVNPLLSLASPEVYKIPMLLVIGWRGEPNIKDEPQHIHQGRVMTDMLKVMDVPTIILSHDETVAKQQTAEAISIAKSNSCPVALVVRKGLFEPHTPLARLPNSNELSREQAIVCAAEKMDDNALVVSTTGMASRELFEYRISNELGNHRDFLTVGGMGHTSQIALGLAISQPERKVYCFDGDGSVIMHMGSLGINGVSQCHNFVHIVLNNGCHGSVGGQPTVGFKIELCAIAKACGYASAVRVRTQQEISKAICTSTSGTGPAFIEILTNDLNRKDIGRPTSTPEQNKLELMRFLGV